jgi:hypothetical protein
MNPRFSGGFIFTVFKEIAMKRTTNYALPTWEKSDFIQMSDFNDLTHKLDTALKSHDDTLNTKADTSAITAVQQEVAAAREANCLVKLAGPLVTTTENAAMEFDLSQVDMTKIAAMFFTFCAGSSSGNMEISVNGTSLGTACSNSWSTTAGILWLVPMSGDVSFVSTLVLNNSNGTAGYGGCGAVKWDAVNKVTLAGTSSAGATATLFAVKK